MLEDLEYTYEETFDEGSTDDEETIVESDSNEFFNKNDLNFDELSESEAELNTKSEQSDSPLNGETDEEVFIKDEETKEIKSSTYTNLAEVFESLQIPSQEPWPKDVKLYQPYEVEQILLNDNANCLAVQAFLKMCNLDFQVEPRANAESMSPSGKVPFIKAGAFVVSELESIVQFVNSRGISLTDDFDSEMKSDIRAYMSLVHNVLENAELYICWCDKETYNEVTRVRHGSIYPWPLNHILNRAKRAAIIKKLKALDVYKKSLDEVFVEVENCCQALSDRLEDHEYFFGDKPTELDALIFGHLFTILTTPLPHGHLARLVRNYPTLIELVRRIEEKYFKKESKD